MKNKLKKVFTSAICLLLSLTFITGCGGSGDSGSSSGDSGTSSGDSGSSSGSGDSGTSSGDSGSSSGSGDSGTSSGDSGSSSGDSGSSGGSTVKTYDTETRPFVMAIGAIDGNFNPFFYTAQNDGTVASLTQVSLLSTDASGNPYCGEDVPTVAKDYTLTESADATETTYRFLIKNGMKFSDGYDLTVMDVLFSIYVTLDVAYSGSLTLYSTDIQGLNAYRSQDPTYSDSDTKDYTSTFINAGQQRINNIIEAYSTSGTKSADVLKDVETVKKLFLEEVTSDWTTIESTFSSSYTEESFEYSFGEGEAWKYYYLNEGLISELTYTNANGATEYVYDEYGKRKTTLDYDAKYNTNISDLATEMEEALKDTSAIQAYINDGATEEEAIEYVKRDTAINTVYEAYTLVDSGIVNILSYWNTANTALEEFASQAKTEYYEELKAANGGSLSVDTIDGITVERVTQWTDSDGNVIDLDDQYDVLQIVINDIDPKAIYNFAVTVCPMHYYSDETHYEAAMADYQKYLTANGDYKITNFGVELGNSTWYNDVVQASEKNRNPVGAGAYATSDINFGDGTASTFYVNKYVYYKRNEYFYTMGEGIENAVIKYVRYREMGDDKVINSLIAKEVDYGTPSATADNANIMKDYQDFLDYDTLYDTSGYGYVGINPKFVKEHQVRQAIMKAMNTASIIQNYYTRYYASTIYRPMSKTSWAYDEDWEEYYSYTTDPNDIIALVEEAGYTNIGTDGVRYNSSGDKLKYTFTIAGESTDHPAYNMFLDTADFLNTYCGFDITVTTNVNALKELASGNLAVWAAAWTSSVDPDMYQVYHKDSTASSVKNWNYTNILQNPSDWSYEYAIIQELSELIDLARTTNDQDVRKAYYSDALDLVMDLAVELPTYQRKDNEVFNYTVIDRNSLTANPSTYVSLIDRIWEIDYV